MIRADLWAAIRITANKPIFWMHLTMMASSMLLPGPCDTRVWLEFPSFAVPDRTSKRGRTPTIPIESHADRMSCRYWVEKVGRVYGSRLAWLASPDDYDTAIDAVFTCKLL